ncbi:MAG: hypothetical protein Rubg2KO_14890 [Rubricoccaceae bacterium]
MRVLWLSLAIILFDQGTKMLAKFQLEPLGRSVQVIGDLFKFTYTENPGMAFGLELGSKLFLTLFSILATILILVYLWHVRKAPLGYRLALAFVLGGAFGNVIDRVFFGMTFGECLPSPPGSERLFYGCVIDFLHVDVGVLFMPDWVPILGGSGYPLFPIGNIADVCIIIGVVLVLITQGAFQRYIEAQSGGESPATTPPSSGESADPAPVA